MVGFYEHLIRITKRLLRKIIGKISLTSLQLQTVLLYVEAIVNTRPLTYVNNELKPRKIIAPMHFLSMNLEVGLPAAAKDYEDNPGYNISNINSSEELLEIWKKSQRHLEEF